MVQVDGTDRSTQQYLWYTSTSRFCPCVPWYKWTGRTGVHNSICGTLVHPTSVLFSHGTNRWGGQEYTTVYVCGTLANPTSVLVSHGTNRWGEQEYTIVSVVQVDGQTEYTTVSVVHIPLLSLCPMVRIGGMDRSTCGTLVHPTSVLVSHGTNRHRMDRSVQVSVLQFGWTFRTPMVHVEMSLQLHRESQCPSEHLMTVLKCSLSQWTHEGNTGHLWRANHTGS